MRNFKLLNLSLQSIIFLILIPVITLISISIAWINYEKMNSSIIDGFNAKLTAISSTTGSFIDGDELQKLSIPKYLKAFAYDLEESILYGADEENHLLKIDLKSGAGSIYMDLDIDIRDMTYNSTDRYIYASTSSQGIIILNPKEKKYKKFIDINSDIYGLTYIAKNNLLIASNKVGLVEIDITKKTHQIIKSLDYKIDSLGYEYIKETLYGVFKDNDQVVTIDMKTLESKRVSFKNFTAQNTPLYPIELYKETIFTGYKQLSIYSLTNKKSKYENLAFGYRDESDPIFQKYISSMNKIKVKNGLTYHYSQELIYGSEDTNCRYILDVSLGNEYTPIGSEDLMSKEDIIGAEDVILRGEVYVSKIRKWKKWGLLKVSFAPIYSKNGQIKAIAGADINMEIIRKKRREALIKSIIISILFLIIGVMASYTIASNIIKPITKLKFSTLKVAAGKYGDEIFIKSPKELNELSSEFNNMSKELENRVTDLDKYDSSNRLQRIKLELLKRLHNNKEIVRSSFTIKLLTQELNFDYFEIEDRLYFWLLSKNISLADRVSIKEIAKHSIYKYGDDFAREFYLICGDDISIFGFIKSFLTEKIDTKLFQNEIVLDNRVKIILNNLQDNQNRVEVFDKHGIKIDISQKESML